MTLRVVASTMARVTLAQLADINLDFSVNDLSLFTC
jgi:hypothetical protein